LPYLNEWHTKYADDGLVIIGVHAPEFAFEQVPQNVAAAIDHYGVQYPVALDNDFATWRAYGNRYWPAKYFIDRAGKLRHYHFGEGEYAASEEVIQLLLSEGGKAIIDPTEVSQPEYVPISGSQTPETYLGYERLDQFANKDALQPDTVVTYTKQDLQSHAWTLDGSWKVTAESSLAQSPTSALQLNFSGKSVYLVASASTPAQITVLLNGESIKADLSGDDVHNGLITVETDRLYHVVELPAIQQDNILELQVQPGIELYAFTFGS
jgi:hypothetical protein